VNPSLPARALAALCRYAEIVAMWALVGITALILVQVVAREAFAAGLPWADELARYLGFCVIFLVVPILLANDEHVKVDLFLNMLPPGARRAVGVANEVLTVVFCALFLYAGWLFMQRAWKFASPAIGIPNLVWYLPAMIGMTLLLLVAIRRAVAAFGHGAADGNAAP
jgi:TRAP-type C4-dicarboxylate transport system permease small subunit